MMVTKLRYLVCIEKLENQFSLPEKRCGLPSQLTASLQPRNGDECHTRMSQSCERAMLTKGLSYRTFYNLIGVMCIILHRSCNIKLSGFLRVSVSLSTTVIISKTAGVLLKPRVSLLVVSLCLYVCQCVRVYVCHYVYVSVCLSVCRQQ